MQTYTSDEQHFQALQNLNIQNRVFWAGIHARDAELRSMTTESLGFVVDLDPVKHATRSELGAKGGRAPKADTLTLAIREAAKENPKISASLLGRNLIRRDEFTFFDENDHVTESLRASRYIQFHSRNGQLKVVNVSALKHRLSREKKRVAQSG